MRNRQRPSRISILRAIRVFQTPAFIVNDHPVSHHRQRWIARALVAAAREN
jgi:hypothetical protein